jgi:dTDP-4-dehydrorhamnose reductase
MLPGSVASADTVPGLARLFVTGLGGYLGRALGERARAAGWHVAGIEGSTQLDVRDVDAVRRAMAAEHPDVVVHTAYRMDDASVNVEGTRSVVAAAGGAGARMLHLSTDVVFGDCERPLTEDDAPGPVTPYGACKLEAERLCASDALIVRTSLLYGGDRPSPHEVAAIEAADGVREMAFFTDEIRCPIAVGDLAAALLELATLNVTGPLHVAGADALTRLDFARLVASRHGRDPSALRGGVGGPGRPKRLALDCSRAHELLSVRLRGAREVLAS